MSEHRHTMQGNPPTFRWLGIFGAVVGLATMAGQAAATDSDLRTVAGMANHNRTLLVFAPSMRDPKLTVQRGVMARFAAGASTRDLVLVQVAGNTVIGARDDAGKLRRRFQTPPARFRVLLIGKDGHPAVDAATPLDEGRLRAAIDAMPMRREEVRRARSGGGRAE